MYVASRVSTTYDNSGSIVVRRSVHIQKFAARFVVLNRVDIEMALELKLFFDLADAPLRFRLVRVVPLVDCGACMYACGESPESPDCFRSIILTFAPLSVEASATLMYLLECTAWMVKASPVGADI